MLFIDTTEPKEIEKYRDLGIISGITTNQKIFLKEKCKNFKERIKELAKVSDELPLNLELTCTSGTDKQLEKEALNFFESAKNVVIKVPMWSDGRGLRIAKRLKKVGVPVNITCCMSTEQVILASLVDVCYVSLFFNRIIDYNLSQKFSLKEAYVMACETISDSRDYLNEIGSQTQIIAGSIRDPTDVTSALISGADIVTVPPNILEEMFKHPKTEETIKDFDDAWKALNQE